jgi:hypothetical protein
MILNTQNTNKYLITKLYEAIYNSLMICWKSIIWKFISQSNTEYLNPKVEFQ